MKAPTLLTKTTPQFWGLLILALAIVLHAQNGRYYFVHQTLGQFSKYDTRTGEGFFCSAASDDCLKISKSGFQPMKQELESLMQRAQSIISGSKESQ